MFCRNCGANNADNAAFCVSCGTPMANEQPVAQEPVQPVYQEPVQPVYQEPAQPVYQQPLQQPVYQQPVYQQPVYQQPVYQQPVYQAPVQPVYNDSLPGKALGIIGMILGILSFFFIFATLMDLPILLSPLCAITGLVLSAIAKSKANHVGKTNGMGIVGMIFSIIVLAIWVLAVLIVVVGGASLFRYYF